MSEWIDERNEGRKESRMKEGELERNKRFFSSGTHLNEVPTVIVVSSDRHKN
jgi:hypothetical protein